jgi:hypothetical protein
MTLENLILDEAEQCYNRLVEAHAAKCINDLSKDIVSSSSIDGVQYIQGKLFTDNKYRCQGRLNIEKILTKLEDGSIDNDNDILDPEIKQEEFIFTDGDSPNKVMDLHQNENETLHYSPQIEQSSKRSIFDTKDLF